MAQTEPASRAFELDGKRYELSGGSWYLRTLEGEVYQVDPRVITVKFKPGSDRADQEVLHQALETNVLREALTGFVDVRLPAGADAFDAVLAYRQSPLIDIAEVNTFGVYAVIPDDSFYGSQWHHPIIQTEEAWDMVTGDPDIIVAILDSGTEFTHPDLGMGGDAHENVWLNLEEDPWADPNNPNTGDGIDGGNGFIDDWKGWDFDQDDNDGRGSISHGTQVAGIVGAKTQNGTGIAGVAGGWNDAGVSLMICNVGHSVPNGSVLDDAILYAAQNGAHVIQMSLGVGSSAAIDAALETAFDTFGVFIVNASGNGGVMGLNYPATDEHVMSVGATTQSELRASFSNHGPDLDVSAPGTSIFSTVRNAGYNSGSGTSFAAPIVSGVAGLLLSADPTLTNQEIWDILIDTADKTGGYNYDWSVAKPGHSRELGYGRVNAYEALRALQPDFEDLAAQWPNGITVLDLVPLVATR